MSRVTFTLSDAVLRRMCQVIQFPLENFDDEMILFGIRGALPNGASNTSFDYSSFMEFEDSHTLQLVKVNYYYPRCIIGQWLPAERKVAVFPGSTLPNLGYIHHRNKRSHQFNRLVEGIYSYRKGNHPGSSSGFQQHRAVRMKGRAVVRRANFTVRAGRAQINYGNRSQIMVARPGDNIHAARNNPSRTLVRSLRNSSYSFSFPMADYYSSYGCQVVAGQPTQYIPSGQTTGAWNGWDKYQKNLYEDFSPDQQLYKYILFNGTLANRIATNPAPKEAFLVYGSEGPLVERVQERLTALSSATTGRPYFTANIDDIYGHQMANAVIQFQKDNFGGEAHSMVTPRTRNRLGITDWQSF